MEQDDDVEKTVSREALINLDIDRNTTEGAFILDCLKCVSGDLSVLPSVVSRYEDSWHRQDIPEPLVLQQFRANRAFESCAQKAMQEGHPEGMAAVVTRAGRSARIAQRFYAAGNLTDGAYWLQRVINLQGEAQGLNTAGRIFIQYRSTLTTGAALLQQSARLGNHEASQLLFSLYDPSSYLYQDMKP